MVFKSIEKTSVPSLSELTHAIGPIDADDSKTNTKPLCANIFDVQRGELMEEYERLRKVFWSNVTVTTTIEPTQPTTQQPVEIAIVPPVREPTPIQPHLQPMAPTITKSPSPLPLTRKRPLSETQSFTGKRLKANSVQQGDSSPIVKLSPKKAYASLLKLKQVFIRQLKTADGYNESKLISMLSDVKRTKSSEQTRHLAIYLVPVAKAMRRETITKTLEQWFV